MSVFNFWPLSKLGAQTLFVIPYPVLKHVQLVRGAHHSGFLFPLGHLVPLRC